MKTRIYFSISFFLILTATLFAQTEPQDKSSDNIFGVSMGVIPPKNSGVYIDAEPYNLWLDRKTTPVFQVFYLRKVSLASYLGGYFEFEKANYEDYLDIKRLNFGLQYMGKFPQTPFHMQMGSYFGFGFISPKQFDTNLTGIDYGAIVGPAFEKDNLGISLQVHAGLGYYWSKNNPESTLFFLPKIFLKVYRYF